MRALLAYDGRATATGGDIGGPAFLPAEGALFSPHPELYLLEHLAMLWVNLKN